MRYTHELVCCNEAVTDIQFCIYQQFKKSVHVASLAWICQTCAPGAKTVFRWSDELHFSWGYAQNLAPGENVFTVQSVPVRGGEHVRLSLQKNGNYAFSSTPGDIPLIQTDGSVLNQEVAVGLGMKAECMCDVSALMIPAMPNFQYVFDSEVEYYLAWNPACNLQNGDVLDLDAITSQKITFPRGRAQLVALLDESNKLTVSPPRLRTTQ